MRILFCIALFILGAFQYTFWFGPNGYFALQQLAYEIEAQQELNLSILQANLELREEIAELRSSHMLIEEIARRDLGMIAPGETFYLVVDSTDQY
ncbi:MAG: cell division protein FtsB [Gammaproteobacteria bacterium]|nr:cell division protein FtsB [Gammaproteobacteria bacterium]MYI77379.1 cell division protein FtsB [Gammaproteobacteria bacterium]